MARVLLVNPSIYDFAAYDLWAKPLGLLYVAAVLEKLGHDVRLVDCLDRFHPSVVSSTGKYAPKKRRFGTGCYPWRPVEKPSCYGGVPRIYKRFGLDADTIRAQLASAPRPDCIGVTSGMTYWYLGVREAVALAREVFPSTPVVLGGIYATLSSAHARAVIAPDEIICGPGEAAMAAFVARVAGGAPPEVPADFAGLPDPAYHLLPHFESVSVLTGRGCPYRCAYCASSLLAPRMERRSPIAVVEEIEGYRRRFGVEDIAFYDDALLWDADSHIKPILAEIIRRDLGIRFHTPNGLHVRMIDAELARLMKRANFATIRLSLETVSPDRLADWDGKVSYDDFTRAAADLKAAGFTSAELGAYVMTGLPGETFDEAARAVAAAHAAGVTVRLAEYSPIPGTAYFERARRNSPVDITEPLMQNNTVIPAGGIGPRDGYETLKALAARLNGVLDEGRPAFLPRQLERDWPGILEKEGFDL